MVRDLKNKINHGVTITNCRARDGAACLSSFVMPPFDASENLFEALRYRHNKERVATARPGAQIKK